MVFFAEQRLFIRSYMFTFGFIFIIIGRGSQKIFLCWVARGDQLVALWWPRRVEQDDGVGGRSNREGLYVYLWLIHFITLKQLNPNEIKKEGSHCVVSYGLNRTRCQGAEGDLWPATSKKLRSSIQGPVRNWILPTTTWIWKQIVPAWPRKALRWEWESILGKHHDRGLPGSLAKSCLDSLLRETIR